jgi:ArsR family transcriptional regulator, arsenate/arsenite/antimonite-responsive transcriptional repressor
MRSNRLRATTVCTDGSCEPCAEEVPLVQRKIARTRIAIDFVRFADMLSAMGTEPRLRIMHLLITAHPKGMVVGDIQAKLDIAPSTLSHHLDKLRNEGLIKVRRDKKFLWYTADTASLQELLGFLFSECCSGNQAVKATAIFEPCS